MDRRRVGAAALSVALLGGVAYMSSASPPQAKFFAQVVDPEVEYEAGRAEVMTGLSRMDSAFAAMKKPTTTTAGPTTTQSPTTTGAPTTTIAPTTTGAPTTTQAPTTTVAPSTTLPATTTTTGAPACVGVQVATSTSIQTVVNANPGNTTFCLAAGKFVRQTVLPKSGNVFVGALGAAGQRLTVLDGENVTQHSIYVGSGIVTNVTVRNIIVERYETPLQKAALGGYGMHHSLLDNVEPRFNNAGGLSFGSSTIVRNSFIHHNEQTGIYANGAADGIVEGNEISFNNYLKGNDPNWEAGGSKFLKTTNLILRNNYVHDNHGAGLWTDHQNLNTLFENNTVVNNFAAGIFHEISYAAVIRNNYVEGNGFGWLPWLDGSGILVNSSANVEIYGNTLVRNNDGIGATFTDRSSSVGGPWEVRNLYVHDNHIVQPTGKAGGIVTGFTGTGVFTTWGNRWENNTYDVPNTTGAFWDWNGGKTFAQWQTLGHDDTGTAG